MKIFGEKLSQLYLPRRKKKIKKSDFEKMQATLF